MSNQIEANPDELDFRPEHQIRADNFERDGLILLQDNFPSIGVESHDGLERVIDGWSSFGEYMRKKGYFDLAEYMGKLSQEEDEASANRSEKVFLLYEDNEDIIRQAITALTHLAQKPEFAGILRANSDNIGPNKDVIIMKDYQRYSLKSAPIYLYAGGRKI